MVGREIYDVINLIMIETHFFCPFYDSNLEFNWFFLNITVQNYNS